AGVCDLGGHIDDSLQDDRQGKLGRERQSGLEQHVFAAANLSHRPRIYPTRPVRLGPFDPTRGPCRLESLRRENPRCGTDTRMITLPRHRTVADVMTTSVHVASPETPFKHLVRLIEEN